MDGIRFLSINRAVTGLASGCIDPTSTPSAMLFVGTQTNLLTYDVENNSDCFYKDVPDGVNSVAFGRVPSIEVISIGGRDWDGGIGVGVGAVRCVWGGGGRGLGEEVDVWGTALTVWAGLCCIGLCSPALYQIPAPCWVPH